MKSIIALTFSSLAALAAGKSDTSGKCLALALSSGDEDAAY